ncbi:RICIN domain-containing protein [Solwaraspora sp. WMMD1047]|uniref:RICIN domain-containing protein n=1 Tax=Solwaraspora sp. WMMD1047 TaxID=3016102 RepID=UPI002415E81D|nr:RICIN domain-containing protein [Solwaraspora sp. WMMD1047]MDG4830600.1 RICIN domain-containing protein [Solwaraspora sp. WMMD1047]
MAAVAAVLGVGAPARAESAPALSGDPVSLAELRAQVSGGTSAAAAEWHYISNLNSGKVLTVRSSASGAPVVQWEQRRGDQAQAWTFTPANEYGTGWVYVRNAYTSSWKAMGISRSGRSNGDPAIQWDHRPGLADQVWGFYGGTLGIYQIKNRNSDKCLAIPASSMANVQAIQWQCSTNFDQRWVLTAWS